MQRCLLYRRFPALIAAFHTRPLSRLHCKPLKAYHQHGASAHTFYSSLRAASAVAEAPSTDLGAGLPEIIETSNVPVGTSITPSYFKNSDHSDPSIVVGSIA